MTQDILSALLSKLIAFETTHSNPKAVHECFEFIDQELNFFPFKKNTLVHKGVESRIWSTVDDKNVDFILSAHIDVVPGSPQMFKMKTEGSNIIGRGVSDMKYAVALYILVLKKIYAEKQSLPSLSIMLTSDEERGGLHGTGHLVNKLGYRSKVAFVPDGGEHNQIVEDAKGVLHLKITATGKAAHAARLWEGVSANDILIKDLTKLREIYPFPQSEEWVTTVNIGQIVGGQQTNQVAETAYATLDIRYRPEESAENVLKTIEQVCKHCTIQTLVHAEAFHIDRHNPYVQTWNSLLTNSDQNAFMKENSASDGRYFSNVEIPTIVSKPEGGLIHTEQEWSNVSSMLNFGEYLLRFLQTKV